MDLIDKYLGERAPSIGEPWQGKSPKLSPKGIKKEWEKFYNMAKDTSGKYFKEFEKKYSGYKYQSPHIQDALKKSNNFEDFMRMIKKFESTSLDELTKKQVFGALTKALASGEWMSIDDIAKKAVGFPMAKMGMEAHMRELVKKGKARESIKRGKAIYKLT
jgi:hypothetical protein